MPHHAPNGLTRRTVLRHTGHALAVAAVSPFVRSAVPLGAQAFPGQTMADRPVSEVMTRLSTYMSEAPGHALPDDVVERAKRHVLDALAAMVSGTELVPGRNALRFARSYGGAPVATVVGDRIVCGSIEAALVNGTLAHADETDDTLAPGPWHPGCNVVPAALALGEQFGANGHRFLRAVVLGYDVGTRVMAAIQPGLQTGLKLPYGIAGPSAPPRPAPRSPASTPRRCDGCCRMRRSRARVSRRFRATPITRRRGSSSAACRRGAA